jgi:hypothetical protein
MSFLIFKNPSWQEKAAECSLQPAHLRIRWARICISPDALRPTPEEETGRGRSRTLV